VLALAATWHGTSVLAVHSFSDSPERITVRLPNDLAPGAWRHLHGTTAGEPPTLDGGNVSGTLSPYAYHWFGCREGV
jgi:hypothetical protein